MLVTPIKEDFVQCLRTSCPSCGCKILTEVTTMGETGGKPLIKLGEVCCGICHTYLRFKPLTIETFEIEVMS